MKKIVLASLVLALGWSGTAFAQTEEDALRYSRLGVSGTARIQGLGGAQSALGSDISSLFVNPAGLGMFRRSEFAVSPSIQTSKIGASINGDVFSDTQSNLTLPQLGIVFANRKDDEELGDWRGVNFGIGLARMNNFNERFTYNNITEPPNTIVDYFAEQATGLTQAELDQEFTSGITTLEGLAYGTYLINFRDEFGRPTLFANPLYSLGDVSQQEEVLRTGAQNQVDFGIGTSYKDKLYLGASLGILTTNFTQESFFRESGYYVDRFDEETDQPVLEGDYSLELRDQFTTRGAGINLKVGVIARPVDAVRLGLSIQTPTAFTFTDEYQSSLSATTLNPETGEPENVYEATLPGEFNYRLTTPFRATGGAAVFIGKYGFITGDVEYVNYSSMRYSESGQTTGDYFANVNNVIADTYQSVFNYKLGIEGRYEALRLRAGYAHSGDPYASSGLDGSIQTYTLGAGVRLRNYFFDFAYVNSSQDSRYSPYIFSSGGGEPVVNLEKVQKTAILTVGYNF